MKLSFDRLLQEANATGFRPESLEKVLRLIGLPNAIFRLPDLASRLVLKGGTALNLFLFDLPRLSVDIDLSKLLPLRSSETAFLDALWDRGEIHPEYLTTDAGTQGRILSMPMLLWKAQHVGRPKGTSLAGRNKPSKRNVRR